MEFRVLNLGAGVQSTAVYLLNADGALGQRFDAAIFADTGEEPRAVYEHLDWLEGIAGAPILRVQKSSLGDDLMRGENSTHQRFASIPVFTAPDRAGWTGPPGRLRRQCTAEYKIEPIARAIRRQVLGLKPRQRIPKAVTVHQVFGISADERSRASRIYERLLGTRFRPEFPLLDMNWDRDDCLKYLAGRIPYAVVKSACVFCPFHADYEWKRLEESDSVGFSRACVIDEALRIPGRIVNRNVNQKLYLHRSCRPLTDVDFSGAMEPARLPKQQVLDWGFNRECAGMCGV